MNYYYDLMQLSDVQPRDPDGRRCFWDEQTIRRVKLYRETPELLAELGDPACDLWPVNNYPDGMSSDPVPCSCEREAYSYLLCAENYSLFEYIHDL